MNQSRWRDFATSNAAADTNAALMLTDLVCLRLTGDDAEELLQGQLTADVTPLGWQDGKGRVSLAGRLNLKGRLVAGFWLLGVPDGFLLLVPRRQADALLNDLSRFALLSQATLEITPLLVSGLCEQRLAAGEVRADEQGVLAQLTVGERCLFIGNEAATDAFWQDCDVKVAGAASWRWQDIRAGLCLLRPGAEGHWLPQELAYQRFGGVSFDKGCYLGQEVVARVHFKGRVKQFPFVLTLEGTDNADLPEVGDSLQDASGNKLGLLADVVPVAADNGEGTRLAALVVMRSPCEEEAVTINGQRWRLLSQEKL